MKEKTLAIYFSDLDPMGYPFNKDDYWEIYQSVIVKLEKSAIAVYIVRDDSYQGQGKFSGGWSVEGGKLELVDREIKADLIFNRDDKNTIPRITDCPIINHPDLDRLCLDKWETAKFFPILSPMSAYVNSFDEWKRLMEKEEWQKSEKIVLKKNFETEGRGIYILPAHEIKEDFYDDWHDILVQEFIDSSVGIPGLVSGLHDIRVPVVNGEVINAFIRTPKIGSFLANVSAGGTGRSIEKALIPQEVSALVEGINQKLKKYFPSLYTIDLMNSPGGYKLVELNSRPGLLSPSESGDRNLFNNAVVKMLTEILSN